VISFRSDARYSGDMTGIRARVRAELTAEIKRLAREQLRTVGSAGLSLRAIARDLDMASSAIYRYFPSRDDLLTALIVDAYDELGALAENADASLPRDDLHQRFRAVALAAFRWSRAEPAQYGLIFGTPVPGYVAPTDTVAPATRYTTVLVGILADGLRRGRRPLVAPHISDDVLEDLAGLRDRTGIDVEPGALVIGFHAWTSIFGTISFLLFGHFHTVIEHEEALFTDIVDHLAVEVLGSPNSDAS
jgi:AcrR family transcriptional regulator